MQVQQSIEKKLNEALTPIHLEVVNESHNHHVPEGSESHFRVVVVSARFSNLSRIERQRLVHELLKDELLNSVHALSQRTFAPEEWAGDSGAPSPNCAGGKNK